MTDLLIYGATGYTGHQTALQAKNLGLNFTVAGRNTQKLSSLATQLSVPYLVFEVSDTDLLNKALQNTKVLLNCSGPFFRTAEPLIDACIKNKVHYLDVAAELDSYQIAEKKNGEAKKSGVMIMPGAGGSVAMFGSLASRVVDEKTKSIDIAIAVSGPMSRGSAISASENITEALQLSGGKLVKLESSDLIPFDFDTGKGPVDSFPVTLPDLITLGKSTGVPNIRTFVHAIGGLPTGDLALLPDGPTVEEREGNPYQASVVATAEDGSVKRAVLHTVNGYTFTTLASVEAARRVLRRDVRGGFQTPVDVFGGGFAESIEGSSVKFL